MQSIIKVSTTINNKPAKAYLDTTQLSSFDVYEVNGKLRREAWFKNGRCVVINEDSWEHLILSWCGEL